MTGKITPMLTLAGVLGEECAEVNHVLGKVLRHGWRATDSRTGVSYDNLTLLGDEAGDVQGALVYCQERGLFLPDHIADRAARKIRILRELHG